VVGDSTRRTAHALKAALNRRGAGPAERGLGQPCLLSIASHLQKPLKRVPSRSSSPVPLLPPLHYAAGLCVRPAVGSRIYLQSLLLCFFASPSCSTPPDPALLPFSRKRSDVIGTAQHSTAQEHSFRHDFRRPPNRDPAARSVSSASVWDPRCACRFSS
jgi:hypothetical protein